MRSKHLLISSLLLSAVVWYVSLPSTAHAQFSGPTDPTFSGAGCYGHGPSTQFGTLVLVGQPDVNGHCPIQNGEQPQLYGSDAKPLYSGSLVYTPLEPLPGQVANPNFCNLITLLFKYLIYIGGMVAVLFLVLGGISYMVSDVVDKRARARERIQAAVWGLLLLLSTWIILNTINPELVKVCNVLNPAPAVGSLQPAAPAQLTQSQQDAKECTSWGFAYQTGSNAVCPTLTINCGPSLSFQSSMVRCCKNMTTGICASYSIACNNDPGNPRVCSN